MGGMGNLPYASRATSAGGPDLVRSGLSVWRESSVKPQHFLRCVAVRRKAAGAAGTATERHCVCTRLPAVRAGQPCRAELDWTELHQPRVSEAEAWRRTGWRKSSLDSEKTANRDGERARACMRSYSRRRVGTKSFFSHLEDLNFSVVLDSAVMGAEATRGGDMMDHGYIHRDTC